MKHNFQKLRMKKQVKLQLRVLYKIPKQVHTNLRLENMIQFGHIVREQKQ